ncbi:MAG: ComEC/Rec2 family competence protein [Syntrophomonadaceae bacterium]
MLILVLAAGCGPRADTSSVQPAEPTSPAAAPELKVHFIDVGQGDAILVETPAGQRMLVDAGENVYGDLVVSYLLAQGVKELDVVVGTHTHSDHIGGLDTVMARFPVKTIYMPRVTQNTKSFEDVLKAVKRQGLTVVTARAGVVIPLQGLDCRILSPRADRYDELNDYSAVIRLQYGSQSFLLTGDARSIPENQMLDAGENLQATVLKVAHHGSYSSSSARFLQAVQPAYGIISLGKDNDYGYPHDSTMARLARAGIKIYRTDQSGTIVINTDGSSLQVKTER